MGLILGEGINHPSAFYWFAAKELKLSYYNEKT